MYPEKERAPIAAIIFMFCMVVVALIAIICLAQAGADRRIAIANQNQMVLNVCEKTCYPYAIEYCDFEGTKIFISCANDKQKLITKTMK